MANGQAKSLYGLCGGNYHRSSVQQTTLYGNVSSTGFLNIYDLFEEDATDTTVTSGRLSAQASEVVKNMFDQNFVPTNMYYRIGDGNIGSTHTEYIPVGCRSGFQMGTFIFYFTQISMTGLKLIQIKVEGLDSQSNSTYEWSKTINDIATSA